MSHLDSLHHSSCCSSSSSFPSPPSTRSGYGIGLVTALHIERVAMQLCLDARWNPAYPPIPGDANVYTYGRIGQHPVVIISLSGEYGQTAAGEVTTHLLRTHPNIRDVIMVGIGGGIPHPNKHDIRLGDVVISAGPVWQYDYGKLISDGTIVTTGHLSSPSPRFQALLQSLLSLDTVEKTLRNPLKELAQTIPSKLADEENVQQYSRPHPDTDVLYDGDHDNSEPVVRKRRADCEQPHIHYGIIATANVVVKNSNKRNSLRDYAVHGDVLCVEMEAAGVAHVTRGQAGYLVVRGICDYADSHKHKAWQGHAAIVAAATTMILLQHLPKQSAPLLEQHVETLSTAPVVFGLPEQFSYVERTQWQEITSTFTSSTGGVILVLIGMGGIGKSQLALRYARACDNTQTHPRQGIDYSVRAWFDASNLVKLESSYRDFAVTVEIIRLADTLTVNRELLIKLVHKWLQTHDAWLLIYDNVHHYNDIAEYLPNTSTHCRKRDQHIIITTRHQEWPSSPSIHCIEVDERMSQEQSIELIVKLMSSKLRVMPPLSTCLVDPDLIKLVSTLQCYPLALSQAGAYLHKRPLEKVSSYLNQYDSLLVNKAQLPIGDIRKDCTAVTFNVSLEALEQDVGQLGIPALGRILLTVCAYLHADNIPTTLLQTWLSLAYPDTADHPDVLSTLLSGLHEYSMIQREKSELIKIHRVLQLVLRHQHAVQMHACDSTAVDAKYFPIFSIEWFKKLVKAVVMEYAESYKHIKERSLLRKQLLPHMQCLQSQFDHSAAMTEKQSVEYVEAIRCIGDALSSDICDYKQSQWWLEQALPIAEVVYGKAHVEIAKILNALANAYGGQGDYEKKKQLLERAVVIAEGVYGKDHVWVTWSLVNLGHAYTQLHDQEKAKSVLERALVIQESAYGADRLTVSGAVVNSATARNTIDDGLQEKNVFERALGTEEAVGNESEHHVEVAKTLTLLGRAYYYLGDYAKSKIVLERALLINESAYGKDHVHVSATLLALALAVGALGNYQQRSDLLERALVIKESAYGHDHVRLASPLSNLGAASCYLGDYKKAKLLLNRSLVIKECAYGRDHVNVVSTLVNLGIVYGRLGDHQKEKKLLERALAIQEGANGKDVDIAKTLAHLGDVYLFLCDYEKSKNVLERALLVYESVYGKDHIRVVVPLVYLGHTYCKLGDYLTSKNLLERSLGIQESVYGKDHLDLVEALSYLSMAVLALGDESKATIQLERALAIIETTSCMHPVDFALSVFVSCLSWGDLGDHQKLQKLLERAVAMQKSGYGKDHVKESGQHITV